MARDWEKSMVLYHLKHKMRKSTIPKSLKNLVWTTHVGDKFNAKCMVKWCDAQINPFTFETGHNIPESKGGLTTVDNLRPICAQCNKSMGNKYSIDEFSAQFSPNHQSNIGCMGWMIRRKIKVRNNDVKVVPL